MTAKNPFKKGTTSFDDWEILKDLKWHCTKCELKAAQAKTWQEWIQKGIQLDQDKEGNFFKKLYCEKCGRKTVHRKLKSLEILEETKLRSNIPPKLAKKIKETYNYTDAFFLRKHKPKELEIDHKFPQIRWNKNEEKLDPDMNEEEIKQKFILLTRQINLLKSRACEKCFRTGKRGYPIGIKFWYKGGEHWDSDIDPYDEKGCEGCFWYDPYKWREELNKEIKKGK